MEVLEALMSEEATQSRHGDLPVIVCSLPAMELAGMLPEFNEISRFLQNPEIFERVFFLQTPEGSERFLLDVNLKRSPSSTCQSRGQRSARQGGPPRVPPRRAQDPRDDGGRVPAAAPRRVRRLGNLWPCYRTTRVSRPPNSCVKLLFTDSLAIFRESSM